MTGAGPDPFEGGPDGSDGPEGDLEEHGEFLDRLEEAEPSGWIPPDQRDWRHPSELFAPALQPVGASAAGTSDAASPAVLDPRRQRRATVLVGSGAAAAVLAGVLLLLQVGGSTGGRNTGLTAVTAPPMTTLTAVTAAGGPVRSTAQAMVLLEVTTPSGTRQGCAVAVEEGGLLATAANVVDGARQIVAVTADGSRARAKVLGVDTGSDIALLQVPQALPVAPFYQDEPLSAGVHAVVMAMSVPARGRRARADWAPAVISAPAAAVTRGSPSGLAAVVAATTSPVRALPGAALVAADGQVLGILDPAGTSATAGGWVFLPSYLVVGVSSDLAATGRVSHGWLGINDGPTQTTSTTGSTGTDPGPAPVQGALTEQVDPHGAAAQALQPGDVVMAIDGYTVHSMAELRSRLYVLPPGSNVRLLVWHQGHETTVDIDLAASP